MMLFSSITSLEGMLMVEPVVDGSQPPAVHRQRGGCYHWVSVTISDGSCYKQPRLTTVLMYDAEAAAWYV
jgi:hypothetical protein